LIPKDNFVFGTAFLNGERLEIEINSIRNGKALFPVRLEVYDMDGLPGIYIPGAITRDAGKQSAENSLGLMDVSSIDPSLKARAAATGITAAKSLLSKRLKQVKVTVKAGYKVLLKDKICNNNFSHPKNNFMKRFVCLAMVSWLFVSLNAQTSLPFQPIRQRA
jgi:conjugative transposon TraM protein